MASQFLLNQSTSFSDYREIWFSLKNFLVGSCNWTVALSSDGTTFGAGDNWGAYTNIGTSAWIVLQKDGKQILFQRGGATFERRGRAAYSASAVFSGGDATNSPTATDGVEWAGAYAAGTYSSTVADFWQTSQEVAQRWHLYGDDAADNVNFYMIGYRSGFLISTFIAMEELKSDPQENDPDPFVLYQGFNQSSSILVNTQISSATLTGSINGFPRGFHAKGLGPEQFGPYRFLTYRDNASGLCIPSTTGTNPHNGKGYILPCVIGRDTGDATIAPADIKGISGMFKWAGSANSSSLDTYNSLNLCQFGEVLVPWDGATVPVS